ncbi:G patch domain-containing protein 4 [Eublepharis macularius]|uniref:G patch domain-containing protein 4 n=1 Tax=Eublepharis macularius TaxID=481883 RepID=A0AA97JK11_EUBMA|nr:G patch domain-containing protein 4 [Eublepharis macularius]XP_054838866.1 G patch domain-containing protein 4 [Eublepharis macularius]
MNNFSQQKKSKGLTFAEKQLKRHGWKKGQGLGKKENGISEAIKVKVKCDTAGVGHNSAEQFTFHWWDHLFNSSAANIAVEAGQDGVKVKRVSEQDGEITNKKPRKVSGGKDMLYGRFVKAATLTSGNEEPLKPASSSSDSSEEDEEEKLDLSTARRLTDEELVQACGGRTAHKGARHGLTMSAKLARLEEQEKAFLASYNRQDGAPEANLNCSSKTKRMNPTKKKKRKKARERDLEDAVCEDVRAAGEEDPLEDQEEEEKAKKRKKKHKRRQKNGE